MGLQSSSSRRKAALGRYGIHGTLAQTSCQEYLWNLTPISHPWHSIHHFHPTSPKLDRLSMPLISAGPASLPGSCLLAAEAYPATLTGMQAARSTAILPAKTGLDTAGIHRCAVAISTLTYLIHRPQPADSEPLMSSIPGHLHTSTTPLLDPSTTYHHHVCCRRSTVVSSVACECASAGPVRSVLCCVPCVVTVRLTILLWPVGCRVDTCRIFILPPTPPRG